MTKTKDYKSTYPVEVEYLNGTKETIEFPRISSGAFFDAFTNPKVTEALKEGSDTSMLVLIRELVEVSTPGLLNQITIQSGMTLLAKVADIEAETLSGEAIKTTQKKRKSGQKKN